MVYMVSVLAFAAGFLVSYVIMKSKNGNLQIENIKLQEQIKALEASSKTKEEYSNLIKQEFVNLANQALIEKNKMLNESNQKNLEIYLNPLKEKMKEFQTKIEEYNITGIKNTQTLKEQIEYLTSQNKAISGQTEKLANAISTNSKFRGSFGEMILEKLLRASGLIDRKEDPIKGNYILQGAFRNLDNPTGNKINPDAVIYLADGNKNVIVDSKASIVNYLEYTNSENEDEAKDLAKKFYSNIMDRIKELENKYTNLEGLTAPDFTLLFIPFEACMSLVYANNQLIEEANRRNIIIVGPSSLLVALRTINQSWINKNQNENIKDILKTGEGIYSKCQTLITKLEGLSNNFDTLRKGFDSVFTSLKGKGGLFGQIAKFKDLGFNPANPIDEKYVLSNEDEGVNLLENKIEA